MELVSKMSKNVMYHWPPDMAAPTETWMDLSIDQSKQSSTGSHSQEPSHTSLCLPIGTIGALGTRLAM